MNEREQQYLQVQNEKYANGSVGERVRLMVRGGCLSVRGSKGMAWNYDDDLCQGSHRSGKSRGEK